MYFSNIHSQLNYNRRLKFKQKLAFQIPRVRVYVYFNPIMDSMDRNIDIVEMMASTDVAFQGFASTKFTYFTDDSPTPSPQLLHVAALKGNATLLKAVLDYKVPVDSKDQVNT